MFPISSSAFGCTKKTSNSDINYFLGKRDKPFILIDTVGFGDSGNNSDNDKDSNIIAEMVKTLQKQVTEINLFILTLSGQEPRLDAYLVKMIKNFESMFSDLFWKHVVVVFTKLRMSQPFIELRLESNQSRSDDEVAKDYLNVVSEKF